MEYKQKKELLKQAISEYILDNFSKVQECFHQDLFQVAKFNLSKNTSLPVKYHSHNEFVPYQIDVLVNNETPDFSSNMFLYIVTPIQIPTNKQKENSYVLIGDKDYLEKLGYVQLSNTTCYKIETPMKCLEINQDFLDNYNVINDDNINKGDFIVFTKSNDTSIISKITFKVLFRESKPNHTEKENQIEKEIK